MSYSFENLFLEINSRGEFIFEFLNFIDRLSPNDHLEIALFPLLHECFFFFFFELAAKSDNHLRVLLTIVQSTLFSPNEIVCCLGDMDSHPRLAHSDLGSSNLHGGRSVPDQAHGKHGSLRVDARNQIPAETRRRNLLLPGISTMTSCVSLFSSVTVRQFQFLLESNNFTKQVE
jgi:hypothetical protein